MSEELQKLLQVEKRMERMEKLLIMNGKELFTPDEAALFMNVGVDHVYKLTSGKCPAIGYSKPNGKNKYIRKTDLLAYMSQNRKMGNAELEKAADHYTKH